MLTRVTPEQLQRPPPGVFIVNFENISHLFLVFLLLTLNRKMLTGKTLILKTLFFSEVYLGPCQRSLMELFFKNG